MRGRRECTSRVTVAPLVVDVLPGSVHHGTAPGLGLVHLHTGVVYLALVSEGEHTAAVLVWPRAVCTTASAATALLAWGDHGRR